jgi:hypothetical protein
MPRGNFGQTVATFIETVCAARAFALAVKQGLLTQEQRDALVRESAQTIIPIEWVKLADMYER